MAMILDGHIGMGSLDIGYDLTQRYRTSDTCHILDTDFIGPQLNQLQCHVRVIFHRMDRRMRDAERALRNHACFLGVCDGRSDITDIIQSAESTRDICSLSLLYLIKQFPHIGRHRTHAKAVQSTVQHVSLYTGFVEGFRPRTYSLIRILAKQ